MLATVNNLKPQPNVRIELIEERKATELFASSATPADRLIFPNGVYDKCQQAFGASQNGKLVGFVTIRDAKIYYSSVKASIQGIPKDELLRFLNRVPLYDPDFLATQSLHVLQSAVLQITWVACGGRKGYQGDAHGVELFARFIDPAERGKGIGTILLQGAIKQLTQPNKLPIRTLPTNEDRTYRGLDEAERAKLIIMNRDWFIRGLAA